MHSMFSPRYVVFLLLTQHWVAAKRPSYVYQKDVSEYCRRRAIPSVFLSRHVADANAEMLYFTKLELPYNCFISIRTETSSNIIMVIQLTSGPELVEACKEGPNQLMVYEFGETFGGYWGPIPEAVLNMNRNATTPRQYTLRTSRPTTTQKPHVSVYSTVQKVSKSFATTTWRSTENGDFFKVEVPLMNLSGNLLPGDWSSESPINAFDDFDAIYDVTPRPYETYMSTIVPLMQFSVNKQIQDPGEPSDVEARYELDYEDHGIFTPDKRLIMMQHSTRSYYRNRNLWKPKRRKEKRPKNAPLFNREVGGIRTPFRKNYDHLANEHGVMANPRQVIDRKNSAINDSFKLIEDLMKTLNKSSDLPNYEAQLRQSYLPILKNISDTNFNSSAYLVPWPLGTFLPVTKIDISRTNHNSKPRKGTNPVYSTNSSQAGKPNNLNSVTRKLTNTIVSENKYKSSFMKINESSNGFTRKEGKHATSSSYVQAAHTVSTKTNNTNSSTTTKAKEESKVGNNVSSTRKSSSRVTVSPEKITQSLSGTLVDHESWENVVQVAPAIAGLLNQIAPLSATTTGVPLTRKTEAVSPNTNAHRKRRSIAPIPILSARPHVHRTSYQRTSTEREQRFADSEHFAQLVELPDDEMSPRVALRFMRQYAGQVLFDICQQYEVEHKLRHLVLFNSSRIILAIRNYTISRMTVVVTTARALRGSEPRCPDANIECQVGGTRVCIDETSACDGIPNCGALDIYDEDRLECGASEGLLHNVYLAAFTFLALLLTGLYIVHYWLRRCVPGVADAFFVYTDGSENVLYLDTIMRSPTDLNIPNKNNGEGLFEANMYHPYSYEYSEVKSKSFCQRFRSKFLRMMKFKQKRDSILSGEDRLKPAAPRKMYSFAELEIQNISRNLKVDEEVQTGESLEMAFLKMMNSKNLEAPLVEKPSPISHFQRPFEFPKRDRNKSVTIKSSVLSADSSAEANWTFAQRATVAEDEKELETTFYDPQEEQLDEDSKVSAGMSSAQATKRLRFDQKMRLISTADVEEVKDAPSVHRHSVVLPHMTRPQRRNIHNLDVTPLDHSPSTSDIRSFFKVKKRSKKKDQK